MAEKPVRKYKLADDAMLERAQTFHDRLEGELVIFGPRFPWLDAAWLAAFQTDILTADRYPSDENVILDQHLLTGDVRSALQQGHAALVTLGLYAKLAFPKDLARQRAFGQQHWTAARFSTLKLNEALGVAHAKAADIEFKDDLLNKGYTEFEIDTLEDLSEELQLKNRLQESAKLGRQVNSHDRVALHNVVWQHMQTIAVCAKVVWLSDAERRAQYQLYPSKTVAEEEED
jgi:hypothetical protein